MSLLWSPLTGFMLKPTAKRTAAKSCPQPKLEMHDEPPMTDPGVADSQWCDSWGAAWGDAWYDDAGWSATSGSAWSGMCKDEWWGADEWHDAAGEDEAADAPAPVAAAPLSVAEPAVTCDRPASPPEVSPAHQHSPDTSDDDWGNWTSGGLQHGWNSWQNWWWSSTSCDSQEWGQGSGPSQRDSQHVLAG